MICQGPRTWRAVRTATTSTPSARTALTCWLYYNVIYDMLCYVYHIIVYPRHLRRGSRGGIQSPFLAKSQEPRRPECCVEEPSTANLHTTPSARTSWELIYPGTYREFMYVYVCICECVYIYIYIYIYIYMAQVAQATTITPLPAEKRVG